MKAKLDENLGSRGTALFRRAGHDVATVVDQKLCSASDRDLIETCRGEGRCLVTLDMDFANPLVFPPDRYVGIAVIRLPAKPAANHVLEGIQTLLDHAESTQIEGRLWVVEQGRIREYQAPQES